MTTLDLRVVICSTMARLMKPNAKYKRESIAKRAFAGGEVVTGHATHFPIDIK